MYLLDTNILMKSPSAIELFLKEKEQVVIYIGSIYELDRLKFSSLDEEVKFNARRALRLIAEFKNEIIFLTPQETKAESLRNVDDKLIDLAKQECVTLVTNDLAMILKAEAAGITTKQIRINNDYYSGIREVFYDDSNAATLLLPESIKKLKLKTNEFVIFRKEDDSSSYSVAWNHKGHGLKFLTDNIIIKNDYYGKNSPKKSRTNLPISYVV